MSFFFYFLAGLVPSACALYGERNMALKSTTQGYGSVTIYSLYERLGLKTHNVGLGESEMNNYLQTN